MLREVAAALALIGVLASPAAALTIEVKEVRAPASAVLATIQLRDVVPDRFKKIVDRGGQLHLRLQAELWESRPVWDRLVYPAIVRMFRMAHRPPGRDLAIEESGGGNVFSSLPSPWELLVDLGSRDRIAAPERYYVHVVATIGTLADRDAEDVNDAVFGKESDDNALSSVGRMLFRTALRVGDYLQSVSAEVRSRKVQGADIIRP